MELMNIETKAVVDAVKNEDGTYTVEGQKVEAKDMASRYARIKPKEKEEVKDMEVVSSNETMSDSIENLAKALVKANGAMSNGKKNKEGYNYKYLTLDSLADMTRPILLKNGLALMQTHQLSGNIVMTHTTIMHESGEWMKSTLGIPLTPTKQLSVPQQVGVICTYSRRYVIQDLSGS